MNTQLAMMMTILVPIIGAVLIRLCSARPNLREAMTLLTALLLLVCVGSLLPAVLDGHQPELLLLETIPGLPLFFKLEPLGMIFALVASSLWIVNSVYSIGYMRSNNEHHQTRFYICFAVALASSMGIALAGNMFTLFVFYEVLTLSTYPLVIHKGTPEAKRAGRTYLGILMGTSIGFLLLAVLWTWSVSGTLDFQAGGILAGNIQGPAVALLLFLYMYGLGKAALMPIHRWLPAAMVAPTPVSALLHAVAVVKAGVFSVVKVVVYIFGLDLLNSVSASQWLLYMASFTVLTASVIALRQDNLKRRLAYSTISQLGYVVLACAVLAPLSIIGAGLHIVAHAFGKITLFFAAGAIYTAAHKTQVSELDGIGRAMPWTMTAFAIGSLSMIGLPPTAGFISKWYMLLGALSVDQYIAVAVMVISTLLNAGYFLPIVYRAFFKPADQSHPHGEAPLSMVVALSFTAAMTVLIFLFPQTVLSLAQQIVELN